MTADRTGPHADLGAYLRARRAALSPAEVGLPAGAGTRRVRGLRREELAAVAGVSVDYYTRLEQGRAPHVSQSVLVALARGLRLTPDEAHHLERLAHGAASPTVVDPVLDVDPATHAVLAAYTGPAFVLGPGMELLAMTPVARALHPGASDLPDGERTMADYVFRTPAARTLYVDRDVAAQDVTSYLGWALAKFGPSAHTERTIRRLDEASAEFATLWRHRPARKKDAGRKRLMHPEVGPIAVLYQSLDVLASPGQTLVAYAPADARSAEALDLLRLGAERPAAVAAQPPAGWAAAPPSASSAASSSPSPRATSASPTATP